MKNVRNTVRIMVLIAFVLLAGRAQAASVLVAPGSYYGNAAYSSFTGAIGTAASEVRTTSSFSDYSLMMQYDAIFLDLRGSTTVLSGLEVGNITNYIATGRKVLLMGENDVYHNWNAQILGLVGGTPGEDAPNGIAIRKVVNPLTENVTYVYLDGAGTAVGGTSLFNHNWATLWGLEGTVLSLLDLGMLSDANWNTYKQFGINVAEWLADSTPPATTPIPAAAWLLGTGLAGLIGIRRMKKA